MSPQHLEFNTAYELIAYATEKLEPHTLVEDLDAAVVAVLITAIETATYRQLKPIDQLFMEKKDELR
jgi:hypothetical protein